MIDWARFAATVVVWASFVALIMTEPQWDMRVGTYYGPEHFNELLVGAVIATAAIWGLRWRVLQAPKAAGDREKVEAK